jgi:hypothetical protein
MKGKFGEIDVAASAPQITGTESDLGYVAASSLTVLGVTEDLKGSEIEERQQVEVKLFVDLGPR